jgi:peptide-N4-(N-acetyl-beta-glucosaminyl)asparagine amidase
MGRFWTANCQLIAVPLHAVTIQTHSVYMYGLAQAFDGNPTTKWLDFGGCQPGRAWLEYRLMPDQPEVLVARYELVSAGDAPERDPRDIELQAWDDEAGQYVSVDTRDNLLFDRRNQRLQLSVAKPRPSRRFRLLIVSVRTPQQANSVQLACLDLFTSVHQDQSKPVKC